MPRLRILLVLAVLVAAPSPGAGQPSPELATLSASDGAWGDAFGQSVAISDDTLIVGAPGRDDRGTDAGATYVFQRNAGGLWAQRQKLLPTELLPGDFFGWSVAIEGDLAVVGAPGDDRRVDGAPTPQSSDRGAAYVFRRIDGIWQQDARLELPGDVGGLVGEPVGPTAGDGFGWRVATSEGTVFVSAPFRDGWVFYPSNPRTGSPGGGAAVVDAGAVYAFSREGGLPNPWVRTRIAPYSGWTNERAGFSLFAADGLVSVGSASGWSATYTRLPASTSWQPLDPSGSPIVTRPGTGIEARFPNGLPLKDLARVPEGVAVIDMIWHLSLVEANGRVSAAEDGRSVVPFARVQPDQDPALSAVASDGRTGWIATWWRVFAMGPDGTKVAGFVDGPGESPVSDDGTGEAARFRSISAMDVDAVTGNAYVLDKCRLRRITPAMVVTTLDGGTCGWDMVIADGIAFVAHDTTVWRVPLATGQPSLIAGAMGASAHVDGSGGVARFRALTGIAYASSSLYVSDATTIRKVSLAGEVITLAGDPAGDPHALLAPIDGAGNAARLNPKAIVATGPGRLVFLDTESVRQVTEAGVVSTLAGLPLMSQQLGMAASVAHSQATRVTGHPLGAVPFSRTTTGAAISGPMRAVAYKDLAWSAAARAGDGYGAAIAITKSGGLALGPANGCLWTDSRRCEPAATADEDVEPVVFLRQPQGTVWRDWFVLPVPAVSPRSGYGSALALQDTTLIVGAPEWDHRPQAPETGDVVGAGAVYVYDLDDLGDVDTGGDSDSDGLPDAWEVQFGLDPWSAAMNSGPTGDADQDGRTNLEEYLGQSHPTALASATRYFAEGATLDAFATEFAILNPGTTDARVLLRFLTRDQVTMGTFVSVPAAQRRTVTASHVPGMDGREFSTVIESDRLLVADRTMKWPREDSYGAHAETAVVAPSVTWYLAEGATHGTFNLFYLLQNPNDGASEVRVRYLVPSGATLEKMYTLPPHSRTTIWVDYEECPSGSGDFALASTDVSAALEVQNNQPIIVERAMYADVPGQALGAGHESAGVTAPAAQWFLAEGATGPFFDLFVLVANPTAADAEVEATYLRPDGSTVTKRYTVAATSRFTIWVDYEDVDLADTAISMTVRSTNGVPVIVERAMWWPDGGWYEAHNSPGATTTGTSWALAEGEVDAARHLETYILVANTSATPADVKVTLLFEDGTNAQQTYQGIPARSRFNVPVGFFFPQAAGRRFGAIVESLGSTPAQIVVERALYWDAAGKGWAAGTNALATKLQ